MRRTFRPRRPRRQKPRDCYFCKNKVVVDYKDTETISRFISERGKILAKMYSGVCSKHQRLLTQSIKRARYMSLLPFIVRPS